MNPWDLVAWVAACACIVVIVAFALYAVVSIVVAVIAQVKGDPMPPKRGGVHIFRGGSGD